MFGKSVHLFSLYGFKIKIDASWAFLALLVAWSLAQGYFPQIYEGLKPITYWWMGMAGVVGLFVSIVFHEFAHSIIARQFGLPIRGITLFLFGGVAEMEEEPASPKAEFWMAIAGPIASLILAALFYALSALISAAGATDAVWGVLHYLGFLNLILAVFNLVPAFPLDGGRILRAILWHWKGDFRAATRMAARAGGTFALVLIGLGILNAVAGQFTIGLWYFLIGMFLRGAAASSYQQVVMRQALAGMPVSRFMASDPVIVPPDISLEDFLEKWVYRYYHQLFPVVRDGALVGTMSVDQLQAVARDKWKETTVGEVMQPPSEDGAVEAEEDAVAALAKLQKAGKSRMIVTRKGKLAGVIALKDLLRVVSLRMQIEEG
jgi:Zn-dependent protease